MIASVCILSAVFGGAFAQLFMKAGLRSVSTTDFQSLAYSLVTQPKQTALILLGVCLYIASMVIWVYALKQFKLNEAYPLLSLGYVVVYVFSTIWPGIQESFTTQKSIGIALIIFGAWYAHRPFAKNTEA